MKVAIITPTGARPEALELCKSYVAWQDYPAELIEHIVIDGPDDDIATNLLAGLRQLPPDAECVAIFEDDDHYQPGWISWCVEAIRRGSLLVGEGSWRYYHLPAARYMGQEMQGRSSLCSTALHASLVEELVYVCQGGAPQIDTRLWTDLWRRGFPCELRRAEDNLVTGMKALPGRKGYGVGHNIKFYPPDHVDAPLHLRPVLRSWIGDADAERYLALFLSHRREFRTTIQ